MAVISINLVIVYMFSLVANYFRNPAEMGPNPAKPGKFMTFMVLVVLVVVSGFRTGFADTYFYMLTYVNNDYKWDNLLSNDDFGFIVLQIILKKISSNPQILVFVTALITQALIVMVLYHYSRLFELSIFIYITSGMFTVSMNGIRQYLAAALFFAATKYIFEGNWKKYSLIVLFASTFHETALILIPLYFFVRLKAWTWVTYIFLFLSILIVAGYSQFTDVLFTMIEDTQYGQYKDFAEGGANILRVLVSAVPIILAYLGRDRLRELFPQSDIVVNMSLLGLIFMIISTQNWIFARFAIYFGLYNLILISWVVKTFIYNDQKFIYYSTLICYLIYFYYEHSKVVFKSILLPNI